MGVWRHPLSPPRKLAEQDARKGYFWPFPRKYFQQFNNWNDPHFKRVFTELTSMNLSKRQGCQVHVQPYIYLIHWSGGPYWAKLCRSRAVLKTEGTVFPITPTPRPPNNIFIFLRKKTRPRSYNRSRNKSSRGSWTRWKNSVYCRNQSDCMIYRIQPARILTHWEKKRIVIRLFTGKETNSCCQHLQNQRRDLPMSTSLCLWIRERANMTCAQLTHKAVICLGHVGNQPSLVHNCVRYDLLLF